MNEYDREENQVIETSDPAKLSTAPVASVLMITSNHEAYIAQALDSILEQKVDFPYEIVIGEDCSTDGTISIAKAYQSQYPDRVRVITGQHNIGVGENMTRTYLACRGRYVFILEGDDYWRDANKMAIQVQALERNPDVVITYHGSLAYLNGKPVERHIGARRDLSPWELKIGTPINTLTVAFRRALETLPKEFRLSPIGDMFLWSLLGHYGRGMYIPEIKPAYYRIHAGGHFSSKDFEERSRMMLRYYSLIFIYYCRLKKRDEEDFFRQKLFFTIIRSRGGVYWIVRILKVLVSRLRSA